MAPVTRGAVARVLGAAAVVLAISGALVWSARRIPVDVPPPPDYARSDAWLCRPGRADACAAPVTATVFAPGGGMHVVAYAPDPQAPIDCFYVYPTVSRVRAAYSPIVATSQEIGVVRDQFARFAGVCRPFAPLYRQVTSAGLPLLFGGRRGVTIDVPYRDVLAAWKSYLAKDNAGRGVVLVGHSQGSRLLVRLIAEEIDGKPEVAKLVSAIVPGTRVDVPPGEPVGGTYRRTPLCTAAPQTGCVIAYSSYPADRAMPSHPRFGVTSTPGMRFACVNPMALDGAASLDAELPMMAALETRHPTDLAEIPGLLSATCATTGPVSVLSVRVHPTDAAGDTAAATLDRIAKQNPAFGLHSLDINIALGTLVDLVRRETATYLHR